MSERKPKYKVSFQYLLTSLCKYLAFLEAVELELDKYKVVEIYDDIIQARADSTDMASRLYLLTRRFESLE